MSAGAVRELLVQVEKTVFLVIESTANVRGCVPGQLPFRTATRPPPRISWRIVHALLYHYFHIPL